MKRRGFIAAILAAPLAAVGYFTGNHNITYQTASIFASPKVIWTNIYPGKDWVRIEFGDGGKIISKQKWPGKKLPFVSMGEGIYEAKLTLSTGQA